MTKAMSSLQDCFMRPGHLPSDLSNEISFLLQHLKYRLRLRPLTLISVRISPYSTLKGICNLTGPCHNYLQRQFFTLENQAIHDFLQLGTESTPEWDKAKDGSFSYRQ